MFRSDRLPKQSKGLPIGRPDRAGGGYRDLCARYCSCRAPLRCARCRRGAGVRLTGAGCAPCTPPDLVASQVAGLWRLEFVMGLVAQARPEAGRILYRDQRRIAQPDAAGLLQVVAYQRRTDAATSGATGHGQIMQVQTIGFTVTVEFTVQRRNLAQPRRVGEQVAADPSTSSATQARCGQAARRERITASSSSTSAA